MPEWCGDGDPFCGDGSEWCGEGAPFCGEGEAFCGGSGGAAGGEPWTTENCSEQVALDFDITGSECSRIYSVSATTTINFPVEIFLRSACSTCDGGWTEWGIIGILYSAADSLIIGGASYCTIFCLEQAQTYFPGYSTGGVDMCFTTSLTQSCSASLSTIKRLCACE